MRRLGWFTLARLKAVCAFLGSALTFALTVMDLPDWAPGAAAVLTFVSVYAVPNVGYKPKREYIIPKDLNETGDGFSVGHIAGGLG